MLVTLERPELLLLQARAISVNLEAEGLGREVLELAVDQTDLFKTKKIIHIKVDR